MTGMSICNKSLESMELTLKPLPNALDIRLYSAGKMVSIVECYRMWVAKRSRLFI